MDLSPTRAWLDLSTKSMFADMLYY